MASLQWNMCRGCNKRIMLGVTIKGANSRNQRQRQPVRFSMANDMDHGATSCKPFNRRTVDCSSTASRFYIPRKRITIHSGTMVRLINFRKTV